MDNNFTNLILDSILNGKLNRHLDAFKPKNNFLYNLKTPEDKKTPLSSII